MYKNKFAKTKLKKLKRGRKDYPAYSLNANEVIMPGVLRKEIEQLLISILNEGI